MPFKGEIKRQTSFTIDVAGDATGPTAITVVKINRREKVSNADPTTIAMAASQTITEKLGPGIDRLMIYVNPPAGGRCNVRILQDAMQFTDTCEGDTILIFDAIA
jgi:hypothetical protein